MDDTLDRIAMENAAAPNRDEEDNEDEDGGVHEQHHATRHQGQIPLPSQGYSTDSNSMYTNPPGTCKDEYSENNEDDEDEPGEDEDEGGRG
ncbi:hypothetical protein H1R20_g1075, partial [Candolleomyces eurysporus]